MSGKTRHGVDASASYVSPVFFVLFVIIMLAPLRAADWFDDFSDGNIMDGDPVTWSVDPGGFFPGEYSVGTGSFAFVPDDADVEDEVMIAWVDTEDFETTGSVRTRAEILTEPTEVFTGQGNAGPLLFFNPQTLTGYLGVLDAGGGLFLTAATGGGDSIQLDTVDLDFNATEEVFVQLDHDGQFLSLSAWPVNDPQPEPQIVVEDDRFQSGKSGLIFIEDNFMDAGVFYMARASSDRIVDGQDIDGDFNLDGALNGADIDALMNEVAAGTNGAAFDLSGDGLVNDDDRDDWLAIAGPQNGLSGAYLVGDSNLDGFVVASDLNAVGLTWQTANNNWTNGNFTGGGTNAADLNDMALNWQQSVPFAAAAQSVPEPATLALLLFGVAGVICRQRLQ